MDGRAGAQSVSFGLTRSGSACTTRMDRVIPNRHPVLIDAGVPDVARGWVR